MGLSICKEIAEGRSLDVLENVLLTVTDRVKNLEIGEVTLVDGGDGRALPGHIAALPGTVAAVLNEFKDTTGVDVTGILTQGAAKGGAK